MKKSVIFFKGCLLFILVISGCAPIIQERPVQIGPGWQHVGDLQPYQPPSFVRITMDSLYCVEESDVDRGTFDDEPYLVATGFASHTEPIAWSSGHPHVFSGVDTNDNRRIAESQRLVFEDYVPADASVGLSVLAMENDDWSTGADPGDSVGALATRVAAEINTEFNTISPDDNQAILQAHLTAAARRAYDAVTASGPWEPYGPGDDWVAHNIAVFNYDQLGNMLQNGPVSGFWYLDLDGGAEGRYWLRWHLEFDLNASHSFDARFTNWDELVVADIRDGPEAEIITFCDEDVQGDLGLARVYDHSGQLRATFATLFTPYDRVAIGNVLGSPDPDVVVAHDDHGGGIQIFSTAGAASYGFDVPFTRYDGLGVANIQGDAFEEIVIARDDDDKVYIYNGRNGNLVHQFSLSWNFRGARYTHDSTRHDAFLVGDVLEDDYAEIVMIKNNSGWLSRAYVYNADGQLIRTPFFVFFTHYDAAILADITGDGKKELVIASDGGDGPFGYWINVYDIVTGLRLATRSWPLFTKYDGFAAGAVLADGKDQIVLSTDEDDRIYYSK